MRLITNEEVILHLSIARITFLSFEEKKKLFKNIDSFNDLALLSIKDISDIVGRPILRARWNGRENLRLAQISKYYCDKYNISILLYFDDDYPALLRQIFNPPYLLFCKGNRALLKKNCISVVGTRRLTMSGRKATLEFCREASINGWNVVSGLANGTDSCAHKGVLSVYFDSLEKRLSKEYLSNIGKTIAVLPGSIDSIIPYNNKTLAAEILRCEGCIISEYEPGMPCANWHFVARNRIIAGLSPVTVVIEAPVGSGALITADFAVEMNRDLFFHQSAVSELAKKTSDVVKRDLLQSKNERRISEYKINNTVEKYIDMGALIIKNFADFCYCLVEQAKH